MVVSVQSYAISISPAHLALLIELWIDGDFFFPHGITDPSIFRLALEHLISQGKLETLRRFLVRSGLGQRDETFRAILRMASALPDTYDAVAFTRRNDPEAEFDFFQGGQPSDALIVAFTGFAQRLGFPLPLVHGLFEVTGCPVLYLKDKSRSVFCNGLGSGGRTALIASIHEKMCEVGAKRTIVVGSSIGSFAALLYARELAASHLICLAGSTEIASSDAPPQIQSLRDILLARGLPLNPLSQESFDRSCHARYYFGADHPRDRNYARHFARSGVGDAVAVLGHANHVVLDAIATIGSIQADLAAAVAGTRFPDLSRFTELSQPFESGL